MFSSRVRRRGVKPFIFREPDKYDRELYWIKSHDFKCRLTLELKRDFARVFRVQNIDSLDSDDLDKLFCEYNERVPMLPLHEWRAGDSLDGRIIQRKNTYGKVLRDLLSLPKVKEGAEQDVPWLPRQALTPEHLVPAEDYYMESEVDVDLQNTFDHEPARRPPVRIEHELVYPPRAPVIGQDEDTGEDVVQPLSQNWLRVMLEEQEARHDALKVELQGARAAVRDAASEVAMVKAMLKIEEAGFSGFLNQIEQICGRRIVKDIKGIAAFGATYGFLEDGRIMEDEDEDEDVEEYSNGTRQMAH